MSSDLNLLPLFQNVVSTLETNRSSLNQADTHNNDHGDNMVDIFSLITQAVGEKQDSPAANQLAHAGQLLSGMNSG
ncbi:MAG: hypothetical protein ABFS03_10425, partial [Chloroflexota bacterium]